MTCCHWPVSPPLIGHTPPILASHWPKSDDLQLLPWISHELLFMISDNMVSDEAMTVSGLIVIASSQLSVTLPDIIKI